MIGGCATTPDVVFLRPECSPATRAPLPRIDAGDLWDKVGEDTYRKLEERERRITDWALENEAILREICQEPGS